MNALKYGVEWLFRDQAKDTKALFGITSALRNCLQDLGKKYKLLAGKCVRSLGSIDESRRYAYWLSLGLADYLVTGGFDINRKYRLTRVTSLYLSRSMQTMST